MTLNIQLSSELLTLNVPQREILAPSDFIERVLTNLFNVYKETYNPEI
jgi:hypothetical protein